MRLPLLRRLVKKWVCVSCGNSKCSIVNKVPVSRIAYPLLALDPELGWETYPGQDRHDESINTAFRPSFEILFLELDLSSLKLQKMRRIRYGL
jgi:hypothetical protein